MLAETREGIGFVLASPMLRPLLVAAVLASFSFQVTGVVYLLFASQELGFQPGTLGSIFAIGAASSFVGAAFAHRALLRLGLGRTMWMGLLGVAATLALLPLAPAALLGLLFLALHQAGDGFEVVYAVHAVSLRQAVTPLGLLGRVGGTFEFAALGAMLLGTAVGGFLGETLGLRATLGVGAGGMALAALVIAATPVGRLRALPPSEATAGNTP